jgi:flagellar biosynthesis protein FlhF
MQIKTFRALDMREALRAVKEELGPEAIIISTQPVKAGGPAFGLFGRQMVEVTAAVDRDGRDGKPPPSPTSTSPGSAAPRFSDKMLSSLLVQPLREDLLQVKEELRGLRSLAGWAGSGGLAGDTAARAGVELFQEEVRRLRRLIGSMVKNERELVVQGLPEALAATYDWLVGRGLDHEEVLALVTNLRRHVQPSQLDSPQALRNYARGLLSGSLKTAGPLLVNGGLRKAVMLVGPTGVGKTTTIAKLAAHYALELKRKVALITLDTYRVAAVEQLRVYANILGLSVDVALTSKDLSEFLDKRKDADLILIDTAGRSPRDEMGLAELPHLNPRDRAIEAHLVLAAVTGESDMQDIIARYAVLPVHRLIFTKVDETTQIGPIFNLVRRSGIPVSYISTGQCVPDDLELATPSLLADLLLQGQPAVKSEGNEMQDPLLSSTSPSLTKGRNHFSTGAKKPKR